MFVSREAGIIFIHIWKTGGTSIAAALQQSLGSSDHLPQPSGIAPYLPWTSVEQKSIKIGKHAFAVDVRQRLDGDFSRFYSFAFVRNPWDWLVSWYNFVKNSTVSPDTGLSWRHHLHPIIAPMNFEAFVRWVTLEDGLLNADARRHSSFAGRTPVLQRDWISDLSGNLLVDFVGRFEALQLDFGHVAATIGRPELQLPHLNRGQAGSYRKYYSPAAQAAVGRYFERDAEAFGYCF